MNPCGARTSGFRDHRRRPGLATPAKDTMLKINTSNKLQTRKEINDLNLIHFLIQFNIDHLIKYIVTNSSN